jgi:hypothetical protein
MKKTYKKEDGTTGTRIYNKIVHTGVNGPYGAPIYNKTMQIPYEDRNGDSVQSIVFNNNENTIVISKTDGWRVDIINSPVNIDFSEYSMIINDVTLSGDYNSN